MSITTEVGTSSADVCLVGDSTLDIVWPRILELIMDYPHDLPYYYEANSLYQLLATGQLDAWVGVKDGTIELAALLRLDTYPVCTAYRIVWLGGSNLRAFMPWGLEKVEHYAFLRGAQFVETEGRAAWHRLLSGKGYDSWPRWAYRKSLITKRGH